MIYYRHGRKGDKVMKILKGMVCALLIVINVWFAVSFCEVLVKNVHENPNYCSWNFFTVAMESRK